MNYNNNNRSIHAGPSSFSPSSNHHNNDDSAKNRPTLPVNLPRPPKRRKTQRACDYCREHKLRCDFADELTTPNGEPICKHCADFGIECILTDPSQRRRSSAVRMDGSTISSNTSDGSAAILWQTDERELVDARYSGESSLSAIISQFIILVGGREQQLRSVNKHLTTDGVPPTGYDNFLLLPLVRYPPPADIEEKKLIHAKLDQDTIRSLFDHYIDFIQPLNAIVSRNDLFESVDLSSKEVPVVSLSLLALAVLGVSAMYREMPKFARAALLFHLRQRRTSIFRSSLQTVQTLIVLSQNIELMAPDTNDAAGMSLNLTGLAVRMAHDLGMHRDLTSLGVPPAKIRRMARIWSALIIQDRWYALCYGQPSLIHLDDGDAIEPSLYDDEDEPKRMQASIHTSKRPTNQTHIAHYRIALIAGRLHKIAFGPKGLTSSSYLDLKQIMQEIQEWNANLPMSLRFSMRSTHPPSVEAGFLFSMKVCLDFLTYRVCLNLPPDHVSVDRVDFWSNLVKDSAEALEFLASPTGLRCLDSYSIVMYFMIQCSIIHFYESSRGGSLHSLRVARQSLQNRGTVATQLASRGPVYDPYGPENPDLKESSTSTGKKGTLNASSSKQKGVSKIGMPRNPSSPSPESGNGPPRLLRLRVKISALISMLLEVAEHRRAAVLARRDQSESIRPVHRPHQPITDVDRSIRHEGRKSSSNGNAASSTEYSVPSPGSINHHQGYAQARFNRNKSAISSPHQSPSSIGMEQHEHPHKISSPYMSGTPSGTGLNNVTGMSEPLDPYGGLPSRSHHHHHHQHEDMHAQRYTSPTLSNASHQFGHGGNRHSQQIISGPGMLNAATAGTSGGGMYVTTSEATTSFATGTTGGGGGGGSVHGSVYGGSNFNDTASITSLSSPKNIEDVDLMTLQRWADALLRNPNSFEQQQQQALNLARNS